MIIKQRSPSMFTISGLPSAIFGEAYVVISVWKPSSTQWMAEYNILTTYPQEDLISGVIELDVNIYPPEPIDEVHMEAEAARQAEKHLEFELEKIARSAGGPEVAYLPLTLKKTKITPVSLWMRNLFPTKFAVLENQTKSSDLKRYLQVVMRLQKLIKAA